MPEDSVLEIIANGAWSGGKVIDNSIYEQRGMVFKGGIPVTNETIEDRIGVLFEDDLGIRGNTNDTNADSHAVQVTCRGELAHPLGEPPRNGNPWGGNESNDSNNDQKQAKAGARTHE